jgi:mannose-6-phosphate isomerase-like protein (cupin superfamily)
MADPILAEHTSHGEGEAEPLIDDQPRAVKTVGWFVIPGGVVHDSRNSGSVLIKLVGVYVVNNREPLAQPAP